MKKIAITLLLSAISGAASAQALIARPPAEDCTLATIIEETVTVNWRCVEVYAAKKDWQDGDMHSMALVLKAVREQTVQSGKDRR